MELIKKWILMMEGNDRNLIVIRIKYYINPMKEYFLLILHWFYLISTLLLNFQFVIIEYIPVWLIKVMKMIIIANYYLLICNSIDLHSNFIIRSLTLSIIHYLFPFLSLIQFHSIQFAILIHHLLIIVFMLSELKYQI